MICYVFKCANFVYYIGHKLLIFLLDGLVCFGNCTVISEVIFLVHSDFYCGVGFVFV